ncbi:hypothetical protein ACFC0D_30990 [Streptomyces sp. NPDC056222]|uniref:hypothetical protein n=1 Tax=Streptomyces sp. NPDC056222 TaxID=3345749 RepID=UPI0035DB8A78
MAHPIRALVRWTRLLFAPPPSTGTYRPCADAPLRPAPQLPAPRSPYGLDVPLDGRETALVRPYLRAHEQRSRRLALVLAADFGIDLDTHLVGAA